MMHETVNITQSDGRIIEAAFYPATSTCKGSMLVLHGMAEHYERYDSFATFLSNQGYDAYLYSHRGHGNGVKTEDLGYFGPRKGYQLVVQDCIDVLDYIHTRDHQKPVYLMGHSMGSIIVRNVIQQYQKLDGAIICGTPNPTRLTTYAGLALTTLSGYKLFPRKRAPLIHKMMFGTPLYRKVCRNTPYDWVCSNPEQLKLYIEDPFCGFICTKSFYHDLLMLTKYATDRNRICQTDTSLPLFILCGGEDPVGGFGKDVSRLISFYKSKGYQVRSKIYEGLRHEILNERCNAQIMQDIVVFLNETV